MYKNITVKELKERIEKKGSFILLDTRTEFEYLEGHLVNSILIPHYEIRERHKELNAEKDAEIIIYCRIGNRSAVAAQILSEIGYTNVLNVLGGIIEWQQNGYPVSE